MGGIVSAAGQTAYRYRSPRPSTRIRIVTRQVDTNGDHTVERAIPLNDTPVSPDGGTLTVSRWHGNPGGAVRQKIVLHRETVVRS